MGRLYTMPGWVGLRLLGRYWYLRDVRRHRLLFSERNGYGCQMLASAGRWQFWMRG